MHVHVYMVPFETVIKMIFHSLAGASWVLHSSSCFYI